MFKRIGILWLIIALLCAGIFLLGVILGWFVPTEVKLPIITAVLDKFDAILTRSTTDWLLSINIFINNVVVALLVLLAGMIPLLPIVIVFGNGVIIGIFLDLLWRMNYLQPGSFSTGLISLLPHGIFELSAIFLAASIGLTALLKLIFHHHIKPDQARLPFLAFSIKWFALIVVPLLMVSAFMEAFISPRVTSVVQNWQGGILKNNAISVALNSVLLAQAGCIPDTAATAVANIGQMDLLYDPVVFALLQQRAQADGWTQAYTCADDQFIMISSYQTDVWSADQALTLTKSIPSDSDIRYQIYQTDEQTIVVAFTTLPFQIDELVLEANLTRVY